MKTLIFCLIVMLGIANFGQGADIGGPPESDEVHIGPNAIGMPLNRIFLIRKGSDHCAVRFNKFWTRKTEYESFYQDDKTGDFSNANVKHRKDKLISPWGLPIPFLHTIYFGSKNEIKCGHISLWWTSKGFVYFFERGQRQGDYGIELAPTKWTDISQVNVFDPHLKWYRYDGNREGLNIPVDKLWEDK